MLQTALYIIFMITAIIFMTYMVVEKIWTKIKRQIMLKTFENKLSKFLDSFDRDALVEKVNNKTDEAISKLDHMANAIMDEFRNELKKLMDYLDKNVPQLKEMLKYMETNYIDRFECFWTNEIKPTLNSDVSVTFKVKEKKPKK